MADTSFGSFSNTLPAAGQMLVAETSDFSGAGVNLNVADFVFKDSSGRVQRPAGVYNQRWHTTDTATDGYNANSISAAFTPCVAIYGIGGPAAAALALRDAFGLGTQTAHPMYWITGDSFRGGVTAAGDFLFGASVSLTGSERATIDSGSRNTGLAIKNYQSAQAALVLSNNASSGNNVMSTFLTDGGVQRGSISYNRGGGLIAYNTTSDYRAKHDLGPVEDAGDLIDALRPFMGRMIGAEDSRPMFMAHEVAEAGAPWCVTGDKDAVDADGKLIFQQLDMTPLIPVLIAEIQSLRARLSALEAGA